MGVLERQAFAVNESVKRHPRRRCGLPRAEEKVDVRVHGLVARRLRAPSPAARPSPLFELEGRCHVDAVCPWLYSSSLQVSIRVSTARDGLQEMTLLRNTVAFLV